MDWVCDADPDDRVAGQQVLRCGALRRSCNIRHQPGIISSEQRRPWHRFP